MYELVTTSKFRKDLARAKARGFDVAELRQVLGALCEGRPLDKKMCDHALIGNYVGFRECHIRPDWLLIYAIDNDRLVLTATRTGTHSELFGR